uniref:Enhancer of rudimentary homolog n=1 Tax=Rhizophora mucronata TaxID=61149 RepID=A0A2P2KSU3_RHIMU
MLLGFLILFSCQNLKQLNQMHSANKITPFPYSNVIQIGRAVNVIEKWCII